MKNNSTYHTDQLNAIIKQREAIEKPKKIRVSNADPLKYQKTSEMTTENEVLDACTIEGTTVKLPLGQLDRKLYMQVAKRLELIGGKWDKRAGGFIFKADPSKLLGRVQGGESVNLKKQFQFFATPANLADKLVRLADIKRGNTVLEPSAGQGAILQAMDRAGTPRIVTAIELMDINHSILIEQGYGAILGDFLTHDFGCKFDRIIANPPFNKNQDVAHIQKMYGLLAEGGRIVSVASKHWQQSTNKKETEFREWLDNVGAEIIDIPAGEFKESGTQIATCIIIINN